MKKLICYLFGHKWEPYNGDFLEPCCKRCGKRARFEDILRWAAGKK